MIGFVFFSISSFIIEIARTTDSKSINGYIRTINNSININNGILGEITSLQWRTYRNVNESIGLVNFQEDWFYGKTIVGGILVGIPIAGKYITNGWYEEPSMWLARNLHPWFYNNYEGIGYSLPAEIYINIGMYGTIIFFFFLGFIFSNIYLR